jgi:hypothetical protein
MFPKMTFPLAQANSRPQEAMKTRSALLHCAADNATTTGYTNRMGQSTAERAGPCFSMFLSP